ncbi:MAG: hypothetical protein KC502_20460 [Myxococcales bacterium]|nr:hypothetical protein [Myxococcales bacterium]
MPPTYIKSPAIQAFPPPIHCGNVHLYAWFVEGDMACMTRWADRWFNEPSGGELAYKPLTSWLMVTFQEIERLQSKSEPARSMGYTTELEACVWMAVAQPPPHPPRPALALPWIWPDTGLAVATGRELYGFRKQLSWIRMPTVGEHGHLSPQERAANNQADNDTPFVVESLAFPQFSPETMARRMPVLKIQRIDPPADGPVVELGERVEDLGDALQDNTAGLAPFADILCHFANLRVPMLLTKQFRDVGTPDGACVQSVVEVAGEHLEIDGLYYTLGNWKMVLPKLASQPIAEELGLKVEEDGSVALAGVSAKIDYSFDLDLGRELWSSK